MLRHHPANLVAASPDTLFRHRPANLIRPHALLRHHPANLVVAGADACLGHHPANLIRPHALLRHHPADGVVAGLHPCLRHHPADLVALLVDDRLPLVADASDLLLDRLRHPRLLRDGARRALLFDLRDLARVVDALALALVPHPATGLTDAAGDHRAGHLAALGLPAAAADLDGLRVVDRLADRPADVTLAGFPHRLADRVRDFLRERLADRLADGVGLLAGLVHGLADRVRDLLGQRLVHRLADRVGLLTGFVHRLADRVRDLLRHRLVDRLADGVGLLTGLVHRLADRVRDLLRDGLPHRLGDGVVDDLRTGLPHRLGDGVLDFLEGSLRLVADAVDLFLLDDAFAHRLVAGDFLALPDGLADCPGRAAGRRAPVDKTILDDPTACRIADVRGLTGIAGQDALRGVGTVLTGQPDRVVGAEHRRHDPGDGQQPTQPRGLHACRPLRGDS